MKVRKYYSHDPSDAFKQIRGELGLDAIILHSQKVRQGGWLGFLKGPIYEISVAVESPDDVGMDGLHPSASRQPSLTERALSSKSLSATSELDEIRLSIKQMQETINQLVSHNGRNHSNGRSSELTRLRNVLLSQGLDEQVTNKTVRAVQAELSARALRDWSQISDAAIRELERCFATTNVAHGEAAEPEIIFVVGPTGVGKTTTIAKLAATLAINKARRVTLVTADTFRVGAIGQLRAYADILEVPLEVVYAPGELARCVDQHSDADVILVDTPGCSPRNAVKANLAQFVMASRSSTVLLAMSPTTRDVDVAVVMAELDQVPLHGLVVTKVDETRHYGSVFNLALRTKLPLAYITTGQTVPEDIEPASVRAVATRLFSQSAEQIEQTPE